MSTTGQRDPISTNGATVERPSDRELAVTRTINAPARIVFEAWTRSELFERWWTPKSFPITLQSCEMDVREEIDAYAKQVCSVMDQYLEKLPLRPDLAIIGGGGAIVRDLAGRHNLFVVNEPAMANAIGYCYYGNTLK